MTPFLGRFIGSHSAKDKPVVRDVAERLSSDGLRVWLEEWEIRPGDSIESPRPKTAKLSPSAELCDIIRLMNWREHILSDPQILRGKPCIKGTRIPVALILGYLAAGRDAADIQREFPDLTPTDVAACLNYARDLAEFEPVPA